MTHASVRASMVVSVAGLSLLYLIKNDDVDIPFKLSISKLGRRR